MGTIVQEYGPIIGEAVNGTVQGRPNGSVYVPPANTIQIFIPRDYIDYEAPGRYVCCDSDGTNIKAFDVVAEAQDLASYISVALYSDSGCTTQVGLPLNQTAGQFNKHLRAVALPTVVGVSDLTSGTTYYIQAKLINNGVAVATSNVVGVEAV